MRKKPYYVRPLIKTRPMVMETSLLDVSGSTDPKSGSDEGEGDLSKKAFGFSSGGAEVPKKAFGDEDF